MSLTKGKAAAMAARNFSILQCPIKASNSIVSSRSIIQSHAKINQTADLMRQSSQGLSSRNEFFGHTTNGFRSQRNFFTSTVDTDGQLQQQALNSSANEGQDLTTSGSRKSAGHDTSSKSRTQPLKIQNIASNNVSTSH